jgi:hypothetical protein
MSPVLTQQPYSFLLISFAQKLGVIIRIPILLLWFILTYMEILHPDQPLPFNILTGYVRSVLFTTAIDDHCASFRHPFLGLAPSLGLCHLDQKPSGP